MTTSAGTPKRGREKSLWPLALLPIAGALLIVIALLIASHMYLPDSGQSSLLDALQRDARSVTPAGTHESSTKRYVCGALGDSASTAVTRTLAVTGGTSKMALDAIGDAFGKRGWQPTPGTVPGGISLESRSGRFLVVTRDATHVYLQVDDTSILC